MGSKLIPRLQEGGSLRLPSLLPKTGSGSSLAEVALLKARNAQSPNVPPIQPISLSNSTAADATGLGKMPFQSLDTKTLASDSGGTTSAMSSLSSAAPQLIGGIGSMGIAAIDAFGKDPGTDEFGNQKPQSGTVTKSTLSGVTQGAQMGAMLGPYGMAAGALIGGAIGLFGGKKKAKQENEAYDEAHSESYGKFYGNQYANQFQAMKGKEGMKLKTAHIMSNVTPSQTLIPKMKHGGSINIIADGKLHKENNNLGNGDKGIPVIDKKGKKIFELEKQELIMHLKATKDIEKLVNNYNKQNDNNTLEELGRLVHKELMTNTRDNSDTYGLEV